MKTAIVLFNLGGPDNLKAVKPFLFNLFNDSAIIQLPQPLRWLAAKLLSASRARKARSIYQKMGGKSPILDFTLAQADALEKALKAKGQYKVFVSMRYWHPTSDVVAKNVQAWHPDKIILLPLYPQFSTTTTGSSFADWQRAAASTGLNVPTTRICCYGSDLTFVAAHVKILKDIYWKAAEHGKPRILFSAHGLPEKTVAAGDPYQWQVEQTVASVIQILAIDEVDYAICYQSKVGPLKWIEPSTQEEIELAGEQKLPVVVVPIGFVSEHSETLVELDMDYRRLAEERGVPAYHRVPALGTEPLFIEALADLCTTIECEGGVCSFNGECFCPGSYGKCPCQPPAQTKDAA
jgi:protoporphyrin/coproporphyrin ferrochelatase